MMALKSIGRLVVVGVAVTVMLFAAHAWAAQAAAENARPASTLANLMTAYNGESNAHARYLAFAKKADEEGYGEVASLFRAAARAEQVHYERHAVVIRQLGGTPVATIETPDVKSTKENVESAVKGETYEYTVMYPEFVAQAQKEDLPKAVDAFEDAQAAEKVHAGLYEQALNRLGSWKVSAKEFFVCPVCGNVVESLPGAACPICATDTALFIWEN